MFVIAACADTLNSPATTAAYFAVASRPKFLLWLLGASHRAPYSDEQPQLGIVPDINPEWPTLITYGHHGGLVPAKVVPNVMQPATRYLVPDDRDFFAVYRRLPGPVSVPMN